MPKLAILFYFLVTRKKRLERHLNQIKSRISSSVLFWVQTTANQADLPDLQDHLNPVWKTFAIKVPRRRFRAITIIIIFRIGQS